MDVVAIANALAHVPIFAPLGEGDRRALASRLRAHRYAPNEIVFHRGDPGTHLYILVAGTVKIALPDEYGHEAVVALLRGGDVFGDLAVFDDSPRSATVVTVTESVCLLLSREDFLAVLERSPAAMREMLRILAKTIRRSTNRVEDLVFLDVPSRVAKCLLDLADLGGTPVTEISMTQDDLAAMVGATRVSVNRVLAGLESRGIVGIGRRRIEIKDREKLAGEVRYQ